jgi:ureidoglycolate lyase
MKIEVLTRAAFAPFGDVIEKAGVKPVAINQGFAEKFPDLARVAVGDGQTQVSLFDAIPRPRPIRIELMERHPLGSQAFYPLQDEEWLVLVCGAPADAASYRCFRASGRQGVNYAPNVWHHPLLVFSPSRFLIVDRKGAGNNLEEVSLDKPLFLAV